MQLLYVALFFLVSLSLEVGNAKQFRNAYVSFEIPDRWSCILELREWVCRSQDTKEAKEAIIVLTAKEVGANDSLSIYTNYMRNPIKAATNTGEFVTSQIMSPPTEKKINNLTWVDGFHISSELPNYYTRYMATIKDGKIAVLVTFSAHKEFYSKYSQDFFNAVNTLNVIATKGALAKPPLPSNPGSLAPIGPKVDGITISDPLPHAEAPTPRKNNKLYFIVGAVVSALIGVLLLLSRKKK